MVTVLIVNAKIRVVSIDYFAAVRARAEAAGAGDALHAALERLAQLAWRPNTRIMLYSDFAPDSFYWTVETDGAQWMNGGLIYTGPGLDGTAVPSGGGAPTFSVCLVPPDATQHVWTMHT
jgi:hypothetical protein